MPATARNRRVTICLTAEEYHSLRVTAAYYGYKPTELARRLLLRACRKQVAVDHEDNAGSGEAK